MENAKERIRNMPEDFRQADNYHVCRAMTRGGGFLTALADALQRADLENRRLIHDSWAYEIQAEWDQYRQQGGW